jgi:hypothetical protein
MEASAGQYAIKGKSTPLEYAREFICAKVMEYAFSTRCTREL